ncbi:NlpE N-terminal domain-containing protein [Zhouia amylolytica]|uniref:NlpE N-terminal domain-containing protein n=1 Tax=Zhouia amylolytica TaxID=376730 RepID=A0A1I6URV0_9FLAO|nr:copper resistance protein NlpE [Zhouia amylolytica]SFT04093.1 NlpE N-terminal domain-containing protein [Zhouia amylolytica]
MKKFVCIILLGSGILMSCQKRKSKPDNNPINKNNLDNEHVVSDLHNAQNTLDWEGTYSGVLPCPDCDGIKTKIVISSDNRYIFEQRYLGKNDSVFLNKGNFSWSDSGTRITLNNFNQAAFMYVVGENSLTQLDPDGKRVTGELSKQYILTKE